MAVRRVVQISAEVAWSVFNLLAAGGFLALLKNKKGSVELMAVAWCATIKHVPEGIAFIVKAINNHAESKVLDTIFFFIQCSSHAPFLWAIWYYFHAYDQQKSLREVLKRCFIMCLIFAVIVAVLHDDPRQNMVAFLLFELPLVGSIVDGFGFLVASGRVHCIQKGLRCQILLLMSLRVVGYANHVRHVLTIVSVVEDTEVAFLASRIVGCVTLVGAIYCSMKLAEMKGFQAPGSEEGSAWVTRPPPPVRLELSRRSRGEASRGDVVEEEE